MSVVTPAPRCASVCDFQDLHTSGGIRTCTKPSGHIGRASHNDSLWHLCQDCTKRSIDDLVAECDRMKKEPTMPPRKTKSPAAPAPAAAAPVIAPPTALTEISVAELFASPTNPRKTFDPAALEELAASIRAEGLIQPITVRPLGQDEGLRMYEIVSGERRYRASKLAGRDTVTCVVRDLTDEQALLVQLAENAQRSDVHPLEEADGYRALLEMRPAGNRQAAIERIAEEVGKAPTTVAQRLALCGLIEPAREAYRAGEITGRAAVLLARIPDPDAQATALEKLRPRFEGDNPRTEREVKQIVSMLHMHPLADATFDVHDAKLVKTAGPCSSCPHLAGNARMLFAEEESPHATCTKPSCWATKTNAAQLRALEQAREAGLEVVETAKVYPTWARLDEQVTRGCAWVTLDEPVDDTGPDERTWGEFLGEHAPAATGVVVAPSGRVREIWQRTDLAAAARAAGLKIRKAPKPTPGPGAPREREESREFNREQRVRAEVGRALVAGVRETALREGPTPEILRGVLDGVAELLFSGYPPLEISDAWELPQGHGSSAPEMVKRWKGLDTNELLADLVELIQLGLIDNAADVVHPEQRPWRIHLGHFANGYEAMAEDVRKRLTAEETPAPKTDEKAKPARKGKKA